MYRYCTICLQVHVCLVQYKRCAFDVQLCTLTCRYTYIKCVCILESIKTRCISRKRSIAFKRSRFCLFDIVFLYLNQHSRLNNFGYLYCSQCWTGLLLKKHGFTRLNLYCTLKCIYLATKITFYIFVDINYISTCTCTCRSVSPETNFLMLNERSAT